MTYPITPMTFPWMILFFLLAVLLVLETIGVFWKLRFKNKFWKEEVLKQVLKVDELSRLIFETNPMCCCFISRDGNMIDCNSEFLKLFDLSQKKDLTDRFFDFFPEKQPGGTPSQDVFFRILNAVFETGSDRFDWIFRKPSGEPLPAEVILILSDYRNEKVAAAYVRDMREFHAMLMEIQYSENNLINALESAEATARKLQKSESQLQAWISSSNSPILIIDKDFRIVFVNETFRNLSGYSREELVGSPSWDLFDDLEENQALDIAVARRDMAEGKIDKYRAEIALRTNEGRTLWGDFNATVVRDTEGNLLQVFIVYLDITDRLKMLKDLDQARIVAEQADESKSRFLAIMSHELRTPMNGVIGLAELILGEPELSPKILRFTQGIRDSGKSLHHLLNDILEFANTGTNIKDVTPKPFQVQSVVEMVLSNHLFSAHAKGLDLAGHFGTDIPKILIGGEVRFRQILHHLLGNSVKFTQTGKVELHIDRDRLENGTLFLRIVISDTGVGMSKEELKRIFDIFFMADDSYSRKHGGLGIGLSLVKKIVDALGGTIDVESPGKNRGTTVTVVIPFEYDANSGCVAIRRTDLGNVNFSHAQAVDDTGVKVHTENIETLIKSSRKRRVLIVEDNRINQMIACEIMKNAGYEVVLAKDGLEACETFSETINPGAELHDSKVFDVILMDCQMPTMDGFEATERIRAMEHDSQRRTPIIALTANTSKEDENHCMAVGMDAFCSKPVDAKKLLHYVERFLPN